MTTNSLLLNRLTRNNQMIKKPTYFRLSTTAATLALVLGSTALMSAQTTGQGPSKPARGLPKDWSMHHLVYSPPGTAAQATAKGTYKQWQKITNDPRYILQQKLRASAAAAPSMSPAPLSGLSSSFETGGAPAHIGGPLPRGLTKALVAPSGKEAVPAATSFKNHIHKDWSIGLGTGGSVGIGQFPATFTGTATPCITDYAVYNTGLAGSSTQATIVGFNNIYAGCGGAVPSVYFAYNTGTAPILTSVDLSLDGTQMAYISGASGSAASLVLVRFAATGGSVSAPTTATAVSAAAYNGCTAPCQTTIPFTNAHSDTYSSPFYDYLSDSLYVGDDTGVLHQFTGVFLGTPAETTAGAFPVQVSSLTTGGSLGSPVYDATSGLVFVGDYLLNYTSTCEPSATNLNGSCGYLYSVLASTGAVTKSHQLDYQYGIVDSPIVDPTTSGLFAFVGADNTTACSTGPCAGVFQFGEGFGAAATGLEAQVGSGYEFLLSGAFDNNYFATGIGNLYVVGGTGPQNNTLYAIPVSGGVLAGPVTAGPHRRCQLLGRLLRRWTPSHRVLHRNQRLHLRRRADVHHQQHPHRRGLRL